MRLQPTIGPLCVLTALVITLVAAAVFLLPSPALFPMDDTYIHIVYGENLATTGRLEFNRGEFAGIGSTSILWVLLIAGLIRLGLSGIVATKILGIASLFLTTASLFWLLCSWVPRVAPKAPPWIVWMTPVFAGFSGNLIWFGLSGMETLCFLGFALLALVFYAKDQWLGVGFAAGLATLTRLEGGALVVSLVVIQFLTNPGRRVADLRRLILPAVILVALVLPWLVFLHAKTGHWLPTSFGGKKMAHLAATEASLARSSLPEWITSAKPLVFLGLWILYAAAWVYGLGFGFPPALKGVGSNLGAGGVDLWLAAIPLITLAILPLTLLGWAAIFRAGRNLVREPVGRALLAFLLWVLLHNAAYAFLFPSLGTTSRYQAVNHILLWAVPLIGVASLSAEGLRRLSFLFVAGVFVANLIHWRGTYAENLRHMGEVRFAAANWIRSANPEVRVAAFDIGALRWASGRPITDLGGLSDADFITYQQAGRVGEFLRGRGATHLAIPSPHSTEGQGFFDLASFLRLRDDPLFTPVEVARFEGDYEDWRRGVGPTANYMPSVVIYKILWRQPGP